MKKIITVMVMLGLMGSMFTGCGDKGEPADMTAGSESLESMQSLQNDSAVTFTDALGYEVAVEEPERTAVLSGSLADAWQLAGGEAAGVTEDAGECIEVTEDMVMLGAVKSPNIETIIAGDMDFVILSSAIAGHVELRDTLERAGIKTAYFEVETFADYDNMMNIFTKITGREDLYQKNVEDIRSVIEEQIKRADASKPSVLFLRAFSTGVKAKGSDSMTGGMLQELGCVNIADADKGLLNDLSMEAIIDADPDFIFVTTMGESNEEAMDMVQKLLMDNPAWSGLKAVKEDRVHLLPKELFHNKPNVRWGESYRILADYLYGEQ